MSELYNIIRPSKIKPYNGFIFLCGGTICGSQPQMPASIRDAIYNKLSTQSRLINRIRIAEDYKDWNYESIYNDLISFEKHIAELSSVIVLVLESPGSLAELGLFSALAEYQNKLLVVIETKHYDSSSFVRLGPITFLENDRQNIAECHEWKKEELKGEVLVHAKMLEAAELVVESLEERLSHETSEVFSCSRWLHQSLLVCDILNLYSALTLREVLSLLNGFCNGISESELKQTLRVLDLVDLVKIQPKGAQRFYISNTPDLFIEYNVLVELHDHNIFRATMLDLYRRDEKKRFLAIQEARKHAGF
ncbi:retron St85 family effector protein [Acidithiobacillus sp.]|jgi:hypothetical protein|uniref:retron St85 family effector protein n=1 Tax=Acidithiobacillus sp. TaxID=1872118 RepID=UPI0025BA5F50|nr:retron St85 family effector protein [Acidithiobacillus sp.]MCK9189490.1 retron St85 family effector protein [Acidithiobacillus sp.]MCK9359233.1 retron St85 family effector protein [Acidithiobacillus sp.]